MEEKVGSNEPASGPYRSRRAFIAGAAGALGVVALEGVARAAPAMAADGDPVLLGSSNIATNNTSIDGAGFTATTSTDSALAGKSDTGFGVIGESNHSSAVVGKA